MSILWITFWKTQKYTSLMFRKLGNCSMKYSHWSTFKKAVFSSEVSRGFSFPLREVWRAEENIIISSGAFWNLSCPLLQPHPHPKILIPFLLPHLLNCETLILRGWLHLSSVFEERKWLWTFVLQVRSKILCLMFKIFYCLLHPRYLPNFNLLILLILITAIAN